MKHIDLINSIVEAEQRAQKMSDAALKRREGLQREIDKKAAALRESYYARADARIVKICEREAAIAAEQIAELDRVFDRDMASIEAAYTEHKDEWADKLFDMIVE